MASSFASASSSSTAPIASHLFLAATTAPSLSSNALRVGIVAVAVSLAGVHIVRIARSALANYRSAADVGTGNNRGSCCQQSAALQYQHHNNIRDHAGGDLQNINIDDDGGRIENCWLNINPELDEFGAVVVGAGCESRSTKCTLAELTERLQREPMADEIQEFVDVSMVDGMPRMADDWCGDGRSRISSCSSVMTVSRVNRSICQVVEFMLMKCANVG